MLIENGRYCFGFWDNMPYGFATDKYEDFVLFKNSIDKKIAVNHIESLDDSITSAMSIDIFTGEEFNAGIYEDGEFTFPVDFLRYYKTKDIGIPYEYEAYLENLLRNKNSL